MSSSAANDHRNNLVLLPGLLCDETVWSVSDVVPHPGWITQVVPLTELVSIGPLAEAVLADTPARFYVAGFSMGGYVALEILRRAPERVAGVILVDTAAHPDPAEAAPRRRGLVTLARGEGVRAAAEQLIPVLTAPQHRDEPEVRRHWLAMADHVGVDAFARQQEAIINRPDARPSLPNIGCPALVIYGDLDALATPASQHEMAAAIPNAEIREITGCGHLSLLEARSETHLIMREWLAVQADGLADSAASGALSRKD